MSIEIHSLSRFFDGRLLFECAGLQTQSTGQVALRGANGSGKTTLIRILSTLTDPSKGDAKILGYSITKQAKFIRQNIGLVTLTDGGFYRHLSGYENLMLFGVLRGMKRREVFNRIESLHEILPMKPCLTTRFGLASAGMKQTLHLYRALLHDPALLLLDEPTRSLDSEMAKVFRSALHQLSERSSYFLQPI